MSPMFAAAFWFVRKAPVCKILLLTNGPNKLVAALYANQNFLGEFAHRVFFLDRFAARTLFQRALTIIRAC